MGYCLLRSKIWRLCFRFSASGLLPTATEGRDGRSIFCGAGIVVRPFRLLYCFYDLFLSSVFSEKTKISY